MAKILVIGELCVDRFVYCDIKRLCPEAPVPVLNPVYSTTNNGMAGNVFENLKTLLPDSEILHWHQNVKMEKTRYVEKKSNQMITRVDEGELEKCDHISYLSPAQRQTIGESDIVIISDYNKGFLSDSAIVEISSLAKICVLDSKKKLNENLIQHIDFIKQNEIEYENNKELIDNNLSKFIITLGSKGASYNGELFKSPKPQETIDVSGAGDTFISSFSVYYLKTNDIGKSIMFANGVCGDVVSRKGVTLPKGKFSKLIGKI